MPAGAPKTTTPNLLQLAGFLQRALVARNASKLPAIRVLSRAYASTLASRRSYATKARATQPTETVKKAVKAKAVKKASPAKQTKKKVVAKKAVAKKAVKKKAAGKKAAPQKRAKKTPTPEQKEKAKLAELRKRALRVPFPSGTVTGLNAYIGEQCTLAPGTKLPADARRKNVSDASKRWKTLTPAEVEVSHVMSVLQHVHVLIVF